MSTDLYLLRHGETTFSRTGGFCGNLDPELTPEGEQMALAFAQAYSSIPWASVYVSPMKRTVATARPLCLADGIPMALRDGLKEISFGEWEGLTQEAARERDPEKYIRWLAEPAWNAPPGGETAMAVAARAMPVVMEAVSSAGSGSALFVTHKATLRIILCSLLGIDLGRYRDRIAALAGSISIVRFTEHGPMLQSLGDRSYMSESLRSLPGT